MDFLQWIVGIAVGLAMCVVLARIVFRLPRMSERRASSAIGLAEASTLGRWLAGPLSEHPGKSGVGALATGHEALAGRLFLATQAQSSIDAQYYIWRDDVSGRLLLKALHDAARRGVRVRLLLDDNGIPGLDATLAALNAQENFEVRLFNPSTVRRPKFAGYAFDFFRMNRRMHNKSFLVDGAAAIIGGRNVGNEYFDVGDESHFLDLDILAVGEIVRETAANFDLYWNSACAYPVETIISAGAAHLPSFLERPDLAEGVDWLRQVPRPVASAAARLASGQIDFEWTDVRLVSDHPSKGLGKAHGKQLMLHQLGQALGPIRHRVNLVSAYFIPGRAGNAYFIGLQKAGAQVTALTNSYRTTDVPVVHAGYSKYRRQLLEQGVALYELKPRDRPRVRGRSLSVRGSSAASLHAKTLAADGDRVFIGSFNFDPRSAHLNCEMGFLVASPSIAGQIDAAFENGIPEACFRVVLTDGAMRWIERAADGREVVHEREPGLSVIDGGLVAFLGWLPIEWML